jgi:hypothetical protein
MAGPEHFQKADWYVTPLSIDDREAEVDRAGNAGGTDQANKPYLAGNTIPTSGSLNRKPTDHVSTPFRKPPRHSSHPEHALIAAAVLGEPADETDT